MLMFSLLLIKSNLAEDEDSYVPIAAAAPIAAVAGKRKHRSGRPPLKLMKPWDINVSAEADTSGISDRTRIQSAREKDEGENVGQTKETDDDRERKIQFSDDDDEVRYYNKGSETNRFANEKGQDVIYPVKGVELIYPVKSVLKQNPVKGEKFNWSGEIQMSVEEFIQDDTHENGEEWDGDEDEYYSNDEEYGSEDEDKYYCGDTQNSGRNEIYNLNQQPRIVPEGMEWSVDVEMARRGYTHRADGAEVIPYDREEPPALLPPPKGIELFQEKEKESGKTKNRGDRDRSRTKSGKSASQQRSSSEKRSREQEPEWDPVGDMLWGALEAVGVIEMEEDEEKPKPRKDKDRDKKRPDPRGRSPKTKPEEEHAQKRIESANKEIGEKSSAQERTRPQKGKKKTDTNPSF